MALFCTWRCGSGHVPVPLTLVVKWRETTEYVYLCPVLGWGHGDKHRHKYRLPPLLHKTKMSGKCHFFCLLLEMEEFLWSTTRGEGLQPPSRPQPPLLSSPSGDPSPPSVEWRTSLRCLLLPQRLAPRPSPRSSPVSLTHTSCGLP